MPFKIVQTIERDKEVLVIVPSSWEENGVLWWPRKAHHKLTKDEKCKPDKNLWKTMHCTLKRQNIRTYQLAEAELSLMEGNSDTDINDTVGTSRSTIGQDKEVFNYELMVNKLKSGEEKSSTGYNSLTASKDTINNENIVEIIGTETLNIDQILENQKNISEKVDNILQLQAIAIENQHKIIHQLATQSVQLEEMSIQLTELKNAPSVTLLKDLNPEESESFIFKPIENQRELISMDQLLTNKAEKQKLKRNLSFLCSTSTGDGRSCAFKLQDVIFSKDFLCNCSWSGGSKGDKSKISIKDYKNVIKFFYGLIKTWDPTYTEQDNEKIFRYITKNAKQRKAMKNLRASSKRQRKNNLNKQHNNEKENQDNNTSNQEQVPANHSMKTDGEAMQIQESAPNIEFKEMSEGKIMQLQEEEKSKEKNLVNNMGDDSSEDGLL